MGLHLLARNKNRRVVTLNPVDKNSTVSLYNGNLTATSTGNNNGVRATHGATSGKYYWEIAIATSASNNGLGISNSSLVLLPGDWLGSSANGVGWNSAGAVYENGGLLGTIYSYTITDTLCLAVDVGAKLFWGRKNSSNWNNDAGADPAAGTGGFTFAAGSKLFPTVTCSSTGAITMNFGNRPYSFSVPSGFKSW